MRDLYKRIHSLWADFALLLQTSSIKVTHFDRTIGNNSRFLNSRFLTLDLFGDIPSPLPLARSFIEQLTLPASTPHVSVLQCIVYCISMCIAVWCSVVHCGAVSRSVVQRGAAWCNVVQRGAAWCSLVQHSAVCCSGSRSLLQRK